MFPSVVETLPKGLLQERAQRLTDPPLEFQGQTCRLTVRVGECLLPTLTRRNKGLGTNCQFSLQLR